MTTPSFQTAKLSCRNARVHYGDFEAVRGIDLNIPDRDVTALIGPSGCGKSTFLRIFNRMNDTIEDAHVTGDILIDGEDIYTSSMAPELLRTRVGMVFQKPNPFPRSVYDNVAYGPRIHGLSQTRSDLNEIVETSLQRVGLWDEVKDHLSKPGPSLSDGQQQRLVIARCIAVNPEVILMDEPASALDPIATARLEELINDLRQQFCIVIITHSMAQAARISSQTAFLSEGRLIEYGETEQLFTRPEHQETQDYITGRVR